MTASRRDFLLALASAATAPALLAASALPANAQAAAGEGLKLMSFSPKDSSAVRIGVVQADASVIDLAAESAKRGASLAFDPSNLITLIASGDAGLQQARELTKSPVSAPLQLADIRHLAPIPTPQRNVYCVGWNYLEHFAEGEAARKSNNAFPEHPVFFTKGTHCVNGPFDPIPFDPRVSEMIDWEGELAVIIGRKGRNIDEADAMNYVFGYTVINDTTARDVQNKRHGGQWFKGKSLDGHGPMGPWIVEKSALNYDDLHLITRVNGVVKQDASTSQMYFKVPRIIAELSLGLTLEPGDIIATGTPSGVGFGRKPQEFLKPGDVMETEIVGIGVIRNPIGIS